MRRATYLPLEPPPPDLEARIRILRTLYRELGWDEATALRVAVVRNGGALTAGVRLNWTCARPLLTVSSCAHNAPAILHALMWER